MLRIRIEKKGALNLSLTIGETGASTALGHVRHMDIFSMQIRIWSGETYLDITFDEFVYMSIQGLHF